MKSNLRIQTARPVVGSLMALVAISGPAGAQSSNSAQDVPSRPQSGPTAESTAAAIEREATLGVTRLDVGSSHFELTVPAHVETPGEYTEAGLTWVYEGQQVFPKHPKASSPKWVYLEDEMDEDLSDPNLEGTIEIDRYGRRWVLAGTDRATVQGMIQSYNLDVEAEYGIEESVPTPAGLAAEQEASREREGTWALVTPLTWFESDCNMDGENDQARWNSDGRTVSSSPMTARQRKSVIVNANGWTGTGTMVDGRWLLTAAHVVTDDFGNPHPLGTITVVTRGNYQAGAATFTVTNMRLPSGYSGVSDISDDYAVLRLSSTPSLGWMAISAASNATIRAATSYHIGYPGFRPNCTSNFFFGIDPNEWARTQYWQTSQIFATTSRLVKTYHDIGGGESGGPFYYYPGGCCGAHYLTGVISAYVDPVFGQSYHGGPKGSAIRSWVIANTP